MRRFNKQAINVFFSDYFSWLKQYRRRVLYTFIVAEMLLISVTFGFNRLHSALEPWWVKTHNQETSVSAVEVKTDKIKLKSCSDFVYVLMRENVRLHQRCNTY